MLPAIWAGASARDFACLPDPLAAEQGRGQWPPCVCLGRHLQERLLSPVF